MKVPFTLRTRTRHRTSCGCPIQCWTILRNVYATGPGGVLVFDTSGQHLGTIALDEIPTNVGWGDDGKTLYITAHTSLYRIKLSTEGLVYSGN
jgi:hypothetical protein